MSRCFPFPPPGYEKKTRSDQLDSLAEEKRKEKKHKKEKKEKREGKEKKEKHRSKEKHKEKKDRKEKHKDKKKKDKDKDKSRSQNDRPDKESQTSHAEVLGDCSHKPEEINHSKFKEELDRRIKDEQKVATSTKVENFYSPIQKSVGSLGAATAMVKESVACHSTFSSSMVAPQRQVGCMEKPADKFNNSTHRKNEVFANTIRKEKITSDNLVQKLLSTGQRGNGVMSLPTENSAGSLYRRFEGLSSTTSIESDNRKSDKVPFNSSTVQRTSNGMGQSTQSLSAPKNVNSISLPLKMEGRADAGKSIANKGHMVAKRIDGISQPVEKDADTKSKEEKAKNKEREADVNREEKYKDRDRGKKVKDKHKHKDKEKEKAKVKEKSEHLKDQNEPSEDRKKSQPDILKLKPLGPQTYNSKNHLIDGNIKKRKETDKNGFLDDTNLRPNKVQRTNCSPHLHEENGRTLGSSWIAVPSLKPEATGNKLPTKAVGQNQQMINGISKAQPSSAGLMYPVAVEMNITSKVRASPHPDSVFLEQLYTIPKVDEYPEHDNQEWLFSSHHAQKPKAKLEASEVPHVWSEAMRIELADIVALPYVVPF
ncbi:DNA ligase 1-like [Zingiber officinale]|uniref:DNA ligase 1-like n=1 Tax=Zingiber officinale TaxID=94328 RepID=UPI001C4B8ED6|nr:DNA ligase 1-like [Zingiber officinale]